MVSCALVAMIALAIAEREARSAIGRQQFALLSAAARYLEAELDRKQLMLRTAVEGIEHPERLSNRSLQHRLENYHSLRSQFDSVILLDRSGMLIGGILKDSAVVPGARFDDRPYFQATLNLRRSVISDPVVSRITGLPVLVITEPILDGAGNVLYILGGTIHLDRSTFFKQFVELAPSSKGYLFAVTSDGLILHHPNVSRLLKNVTTEAGRPVPSTIRALRGWEGWVVGRSKNGTPAILTYKHMSKPNWILGSVFPSADALSGLAIARESAWADAGLVAVIVGVLGWYLMRHVLKPLYRLQSTVYDVEQGSKDISDFDIKRRDEIGALARAFHSLSLQQRIAEARLAQLASVDHLTGLRNRRCFDEELNASYERVVRARGSLVIAFLDIDHFKQVNDTYGHEGGDQVLKEFARRLTASLRKSDNVFRIAGDEFVVILDTSTPEQAVERIACGLVAAMRLPFTAGSGQVAATTSMGVAMMSWDVGKLHEILRAADESLYEAKRAGRNGFKLQRLVL